MIESGLIGQDIFVGIGKSAASFNFKSRRACLSDSQGYVPVEKIVHSNPLSSWPWVLSGI